MVICGSIDADKMSLMYELHIMNVVNNKNDSIVISVKTQLSETFCEQTSNDVVACPRYEEHPMWQIHN